MKPVEWILVPTDLSDPSKLAIESAKDYAEKLGANVILCYIADDRIPPFGVVAVPQIDLAQLEERHRAFAAEQLDVVSQEFRALGLEVIVEVGLGCPHDEIVRLAEKYEVDLILMGTHGRGFLSNAILGSTTERVIRLAPCPVLAIRDRRKKEKEDDKKKSA